MKKVVDKLSSIGCMLPFILGGLVPIVMMFIGIWKVCNGNVLAFILHVIAIPFALLGFVNIIRGFCSVVIETDMERLGKDWHGVLYFIANVIGYGILIFIIIQAYNFA